MEDARQLGELPCRGTVSSGAGLVHLCLRGQWGRGRGGQREDQTKLG